MTRCEFCENYLVDRHTPGECIIPRIKPNTGKCPEYRFRSCCAVDYRDSAEFEGRVAYKIVSSYGGFSFCNDDDCLTHDHDCRWCRMKWARLAVEQEMDQEEMDG